MTAVSLKLDGVSWSTARGKEILRPLSIELRAGRVLGVVGANGAGKSTLLRLVYRYYKPATGRVEIGGHDIWSVPAKTVAQTVAAVLQEQPTDFALTVAEIVALGRTPHHGAFSGNGSRDRDIIANSLARLDLQGFTHRQFGTLSGGERQRVMVARALAQEPGILVLDEPTNHLDIRHQLEVLELIRGLDMTIVTSLHDLNMAADVCDDILLLKHGEKRAFGEPHTVLNDQSVSDAFAVQAHRETLHPTNRSHFTYSLNERN
ncbi:MAG: ABC transporter ATP-binding protein [Pseudomonadota bacterium]